MASGTLLMCRLEDFKAQFSYVDPKDCGLSETTVLGIPALTAYEDGEYTPNSWENSLADNYEVYEFQKASISRFQNADYIQRLGWDRQFADRRIRDYLAANAAFEQRTNVKYAASTYLALKWFQDNAERHTAWT